MSYRPQAVRCAGHPCLRAQGIVSQYRTSPWSGTFWNVSEVFLWATSQNRALSGRPERPPYLVPRHHAAEVHRLLQKSLAELVGRLPGQGEQVAGGCVPGEARSGDGQLPVQREGVRRLLCPGPVQRNDWDLGALQALTCGERTDTGLEGREQFPSPPGFVRRLWRTQQSGHLQPVPRFSPVAAGALLRQAVELEAQVGQGQRQEGQLWERRRQTC